jgi:hypothetical protein
MALGNPVSDGSLFLTAECLAERHAECPLCPPPDAGPPRLCKCSCHRVDYGSAAEPARSRPDSSAPKRSVALLVLAGLLAVIGIAELAVTGSAFGAALILVAAMAAVAWRLLPPKPSRPAR